MAILGNAFGRELCQALGLKEVTNIEIKVPLKEVPTVKVEMYLTKEQAEAMLPVMRKYKLIPIEEDLPKDV